MLCLKNSATSTLRSFQAKTDFAVSRFALFRNIFRLKKEALERALKEQHKRLRASAALEREKAIALALSVAREQFALKLAQEIETTREECKKISDEKIQETKKLHNIEIQRLNER